MSKRFVVAVIAITVLAACASSTRQSHARYADLADTRLTEDADGGSEIISCKAGRSVVLANRLDRKREYRLVVSALAVGSDGINLPSECPVRVVLADETDTDVPRSEIQAGGVRRFDIQVPAGKDLVLKCGDEDATKRCRFTYTLRAITPEIL